MREVVIDVTLHHLRGPDPALLRRTAADALKAMRESRRQPSRDLPVEAVIAAASVGGVERATPSLPSAGVSAGQGELIHIHTIIVRSAYTNG